MEQVKSGRITDQHWVKCGKITDNFAKFRSEDTRLAGGHRV
jgi:hypothetical protein